MFVSIILYVRICADYCSCKCMCACTPTSMCVLFSAYLCLCVSIFMYVFVCVSQRGFKIHTSLWEDIKEGETLWPTPHSSRMTPTPRKCHMPTRRRVLSDKLACIDTNKQEMVDIAAQFGCLDPSQDSLLVYELHCGTHGSFWDQALGHSGNQRVQVWKNQGGMCCGRVHVKMRINGLESPNYP